MKDVKQFAVFGNPVSHSRSPRIHELFAMQVGIKQTYRAIQAPVDAFEDTLDAFFASGARGANITAPFKERAYAKSHDVTKRAYLAGAVNTLKRLDDGCLLGDNTDGIGLLADLTRLAFIQPQYCVLLVGAGGAARGVIPSLLSSGCKLFVINRTVSRAEKLSNVFKSVGEIHVLTMDMLREEKFDLIINATSSGIDREIPALPVDIMSNKVCCYDMSYGSSHTTFLRWVIQQGITRYANGLGMLVEQAAYAFEIWHNIMPETVSVLTQLNKELQQ